MFTVLENTADFYFNQFNAVFDIPTMSKEWIHSHFKVSQIITAKGTKITTGLEEAANKFPSSIYALGE